MTTLPADKQNVFRRHPSTAGVLTAVTGATGFVGRALVEELLRRGGSVRPISRAGPRAPNGVTVGDLGAGTNWEPALCGVDCVIHCAARVHVLEETERDPLAAFRRVNVEGTRRLAEQAAACGVRRLIYLSSVSVLGAGSSGRRPFNMNDSPAPQTPDAIAKHEAEQALQEVAERTGLEFVIVRPPLVYGPHAKGNFARLVRLIQGGLPLPVGAVKNCRSLVGLDNLVDLLITSIHHPRAAGKSFLVSDGEDISTPELIHRLARALQRPVRLVSCPVGILRLAAGVLDRKEWLNRLIESLCVDLSDTRSILGWSPPLAVDEGLRRAASPAANLSLSRNDRG